MEKTMKPSLALKSLFQDYFMDRSIGHIALSLVKAMNGPGLEGKLWVATHPKDFSSPFLEPVLPLRAGNILFRIGPGTRFALARTRKAFLGALREGDLAYLWPNVPFQVFQAAKEKGAFVAAEGINCHQAFAREILDEEFSRLGLPPSSTITDEDIEDEKRKLALTDFLFAPSPMVAASFAREGFPKERIIQSSYGWEPAALAGEKRALEPDGGLDVLFVGRISVRKGAHYLFEAWAEAGIQGRLILAGRFFDGLEKKYAGLLSRPDVVTLGFTSDVGSVYRSGQVLAFPSLEEGSPLVTYEAMSQGLALLVSPMAAGGVVRDGKEGLVLPPGDREAWTAALRDLAAHPEKREALGRAARERAREFTWDKVGARRREALLEAVAALGPRERRRP